MTKAERADRDAKICQRYTEGANFTQIGEEFNLKRQRIQQIIKHAGLWRPRVIRDEFLGIHVDDETKATIRRMAQERGISMSTMTLELLSEMIDNVHQN